MFETLTAWRILFRPSFSWGRLIMVFVGLALCGVGVIVHRANPPMTMVAAALFLLGGVGLVGGGALLFLQGMRWPPLVVAVVGFDVLIGALLVVSKNPSPQVVAATLLALGLVVFVVACLSFLFPTFNAVAVASVFVAVASLVVVRGVTNGFSQEFKDKVLGFNAHVLVMKYGYGMTEYRQVIKEVKRLKHVKGAAPFTIADMLVAKEKEHTHVLMKGVVPEQVNEVLDLSKYVLAKGGHLDRAIKSMGQHLEKGAIGPGQSGGCEPKFTEDGDPIPGSRKDCKLPGIVLGKKLAERLKAKEGDIVRLISPAAEVQKLRGEAIGAPPLARDFRVAALFYCGFEEYDQKLVFVHLQAAQHLLNPADGADRDAVLGVEIKLDDIYMAPQVSKEIHTLLGGTPYRIVTWMELNKPLFTALRTQRLIMIIIALIPFLIVNFFILASLMVIVIDRTREVSVLRAMGVTSGGVARIFLLVGQIVGVIGVGLGVGVGLLLCNIVGRLDFPLDPKVYLISRLPVLVDFWEIALVVGLTAFACFISAVYPAVRAARLRPADGLRYE